MSRIEKGIPIPPKVEDPELIKLIPELKEMEVGDSVLVSDVPALPSLQLRLIQWGLPRTQVFRAQAQPNGKFRIWRTV
jgi:hypothetical protein